MTIMLSTPTQTALSTVNTTHPSRNSNSSNMEHIANTSRETKSTDYDRTSNNNHSNDNLDDIHELTDLDRCKILNKEAFKCRYERRCETDDRILHKKGVYGKESISRKRVDVDEHGTRRTADLNFKCIQDARECVEAVGRTMGRVRAIAVVGLFLAMLTTCAAAPAYRPTRSVHEEKSARSYLETFGYLKKDRPEVGNLQIMDGTQEYEDDFRIAIKTLQEFGGIPVTGEIDEETRYLMKQRRCGRPDREDGDDEQGRRRRKRFAVHGEKWKYTNLTWSLSNARRPSQLDPHATRAVLARALDVWAQASRLTFQEVNSDEADIVVSFAKRYHDDAYPFDGRGSILAHAFFPGTGRGGDAHFDDDELWLLQPRDDDEDGTSLFAVAVHEFGHSLGLSHSSVKGALMFPWYQGIQPNFVLPEDDRNGIQQMYGPKTSNKWAKIPYYRPAETPPPTTTTSTTTTTTTTTRRPYHHHPNRHPERNPNRHYTPYPRNPSRYPTYYPEKHYPERPHYPERRYNTTEEYPRRTNHHYPRTTEITTHPTTYRPRYPHVRPEYPTHPRPSYPNDPNRDNPRKPYYPEKTTTQRPITTTPSDKPDTCDTSYDAIALIRNELFIFKNRYHWRIGAHGRYNGYPMEITRMWSQLPQNLTHVDAVYERPDRKIAIFIGKELYLFDSQTLVYGYPRPLSHLGLPSSLEKLDAAMVWGHNGKTYFYSGTMYWKYDEDLGQVEPDYPRNMAMWKGVGYNIDSVFQWKDGKTYFFKGKGYWKFNDLRMQVEHEKQFPSAPFWMGCPTARRAKFHAPPAPGSTLRSAYSEPSGTNTVRATILLLIYPVLAIITTYIRH